MTEETSIPTPAGTDPATDPAPEPQPEQPAAEAVEKALKEVLIPADRMNRAFVGFAADNPKFPATIKGNGNGHYVIAACGVQVVLNTDDKQNPMRCEPATIEDARKLIDNGIKEIREAITSLVKHMVKILELDLKIE